jgi:hypothetical protein
VDPRGLQRSFAGDWVNPRAAPRDDYNIDANKDPTAVSPLDIPEGGSGYACYLVIRSNNLLFQGAHAVPPKSTGGELRTAVPIYSGRAMYFSKGGLYLRSLPCDFAGEVPPPGPDGQLVVLGPDTVLRFGPANNVQSDIGKGPKTRGNGEGSPLIAVNPTK